MTTQGKRYEVIRMSTGLSQEQFAESLNISQSLASLIKSDKRLAGRNILERLVKVYNINLNWYLTGTDNSVTFSSVTNPEVKVRYIDREKIQCKTIDTQQPSKYQTLTIPRSLVSSYDPEKLIAITVNGVSMIEKEIYDGDIVIFNPEETNGNNISVISINGQIIVAQVVIDILDNTLSLISANKLFPPKIINNNPSSEVIIQGRVIACLHRMQ